VLVRLQGCASGPLLVIGLSTSVAALLGLLSIGMFLGPCIVLPAIAVVLAASARSLAGSAVS
jgi:hypothetical protein